MNMEMYREEKFSVGFYGVLIESGWHGITFYCVIFCI